MLTIKITYCELKKTLSVLKYLFFRKIYTNLPVIIIQIKLFYVDLLSEYAIVEIFKCFNIIHIIF